MGQITNRRLFRKLCYQTVPGGIDFLDAQQWLQRLTFDDNCVEQLYSAQPLPSCATISINALFNEHYNNRHGSVQSGNDFSNLKIKRAWFDSGGTLLKQAFVPMEKQLLLACCKVTFLCGKKRALYSCWRICDTMWTTLVTVRTCLQTRGTREFYESSGGTSA